MAIAKKTKPLSHLRDSSKGSIHHVEIHPAKNSAGKAAFITRIHRNRPKADEDAMAKGGPYIPEPKPEETVHEDGQDMLDHVANTYGIKQDADEDGDADDGDEEG